MLQATVNPEERAGVDTASHRAPLSSWGAPGPAVPEASLGVPHPGLRVTARARRRRLPCMRQRRQARRHEPESRAPTSLQAPSGGPGPLGAGFSGLMMMGPPPSGCCAESPHKHHHSRLALMFQVTDIVRFLLERGLRFRNHRFCGHGLIYTATCDATAPIYSSREDSP